MKRFARLATVLVFATFAVAAIAVAGTTTGVAAESHRNHFRTVLVGYQETPMTINTAGHGTFTMDIVNDDNQINFTLTYADLTGPPLFAHIHFGARATTGGVSAFLCGGSTKPPCPPTTSGTVSGTITAADVVGPTNQGINPGEFAALVRAIRNGVTYANMHSQKFPTGEIRGQIDGRLQLPRNPGE